MSQFLQLVCSNTCHDQIVWSYKFPQVGIALHGYRYEVTEVDRIANKTKCRLVGLLLGHVLNLLRCGGSESVAIFQVI